MRLAAIDLDGAERALVADDRRDDEVADAGPPGEVVGAIDVLELAGEVVARRDDPTLGHRPAGQALAGPHRRGTHRLALLIGQPRVVGRDEDPFELVVLVDDGAIGAQQPARLVDDALEQVARLADGGDPRADLAQRPFGLGAPLDDGARSGQLVDASRVADGDRGLRREGGQHLPVGVVVGGDLARHDRQGADRAGLAGQRDGDDGADPGRGDELARRVVADEAVVDEVVVGVDRALLGERGAGHGLAGLEAAGLRPVRDDGHGRAGRVRPAQRLDGRVPQVDPGAVGLEQAGRFVDDLLEHLVGLEDGRHARRDLAQGLLGVGAPGDLGPRALELVDEPRVRDRDRGLVGERRQEPGVGLAEGVRAVAVDGDGADDARRDG